MKVLISENHSTPSVALVLWVKVGYLDEPDSLTGISHLIEHMAFKGTKKRNAGELVQEIKKIGGFLNASTIYDHTSFHGIVPSQYLGQALDIFSDLFFNLKIREEELIKEKKVVIEEVKRKLDEPSTFGYEKMLQVAFKRHKLRRFRTGTPEIIDSLSKENLETFYKTYYLPPNAILVVSGDVEPSSSMELVEKYFGRKKRRRPVRPPSLSEPEQKEFRWQREEADITKIELFAGFKSVSFMHKEKATFDLLSIILGEGKASRLSRRLREKEKAAIWINASNYSLPDIGIFSIHLRVEPRRIDKAEEALFEEIELLRKFGIEREELLRAKSIMENKLCKSVETNLGRALFIAKYESYGGWKGFLDYLDELDKVDEKRVQKVAIEYLSLDKASLFEYVPFGFKDRKRGFLKRLRKKFEELSKEKTKVGEIKFPKPSFKKILIGEEKAPRGELEFTLENGMRVFLKELKGAPLTGVGIFLKGGRIIESPSNFGITFLMSNVLLKESKFRKFNEIARMEDILGSPINYHLHEDFFGFTALWRKTKLKQGIRLLKELFLFPSFPKDEFRKEKERQLASLEARRDGMKLHSIDLMKMKLMEDHPYGVPSLGREESIRRIRRSYLTQWHKKCLSPKRTLLVLIGDIEVDEMRDFVSDSFGEWESAGKDISLILPKPIENIKRSEVRRLKEQTSQTIGFLAPSRVHSDYYPFLLLKNILSGVGGRLWRKIREERGLAYEINGCFEAKELAGIFRIYAATSPKNSLTVREMILSEINELPKRWPSIEEIETSKRFTLGVRNIRLEQVSSLVMEYARNILFGLGREETTIFPSKIERVSPEKIIEVAEKYLVNRPYAIGIVHGSERI